MIYRLRIAYGNEWLVDDYMLCKVDMERYMLFTVRDQNRFTGSKAKTLDELIPRPFVVVKEWDSLMDYFMEANKC